MGLLKRLQSEGAYDGPQIKITKVDKADMPAAMQDKRLADQKGYQVLKEKIHRRLIERLDLDKLAILIHDRREVERSHAKMSRRRSHDSSVTTVTMLMVACPRRLKNPLTKFKVCPGIISITPDN